MRSFARSVLSAASVKSSVNQPVSGTSSMGFVVRRPANSGCEATSVVTYDERLVRAIRCGFLTLAVRGGRRRGGPRCEERYQRAGRDQALEVHGRHPTRCPLPTCYPPVRSALRGRDQAVS
jgi:hypothetical protein